MAVSYVTTDVGDVDVPIGMLRMRLGLAGECASLEAASVLVPRSPDDHRCAPIRVRVTPQDRECFLESNNPRL
jgi:hypothetical protein